MPRDLLNQGIHIADLNVAAGAVPEAAPTLVTHGYPTAQRSGSGAYLDLPMVLVVVDLVGGVTPTVDLNLWGYAQPPAAGPTLVSDWQLIDTVTISDAVGLTPTFALIPCAGFLRFDVKVNAIAGAPTSVRLRLIGTTHYTADLMIAAGAVAGVANNVNVVEIAGAAIAATSVAGKLPVESDNRQIGGVNVAVGNVAGTRVVEGTSAASAVHDTSFPVNIGGKVSTADPVFTNGHKEEVSFTTRGRIRSDIEGAQGTGVALGTQYPVLIGGEIKQVPDLKTNGHFWNHILDLYRRLWVRSAAFDETTNTDIVSNANLDSTNHDADAQIVADATNTGAGTSYYPSASGAEIGDPNKICWQCELADCLFDIQISNDTVTWTTATKSLVDHEEAAYNFDNTHYDATGGTADFNVSFNDDCKAKYYRFAVQFPDGTNDILIQSYARSN